MPYGELLKKEIARVGISNKELSDKCIALNESVTPAYISKLVNGKMQPPSDKKSDILAKVLGINPDVLKLEAYLDKAPKQIIDFLNYARFSVVLLVLQVFGNSIPKEKLDEIKRELDNMPLSSFLIEINSNFSKQDISKVDGIIEIKNIENNINATISEMIGIKLNDDAMFPIIPKNSDVKLLIKESYENGDIIAFVKKDNPKEFFIRQAYFIDSNIVFTPINRDYETMTFDKNKITLLGKVDKYIKKIEN
jgi:hypothetical protein